MDLKHPRQTCWLSRLGQVGFGLSRLHGEGLPVAREARNFLRCFISKDPQVLSATAQSPLYLEPLRRIPLVDSGDVSGVNAQFWIESQTLLQTGPQGQQLICSVRTQARHSVNRATRTIVC